jgi:O-antigen ligase
MLLIVGCGAALFGILAWLAYPMGINFGVRFYPFGVAPPTGELCDYTYAPYDTLNDSNIFGSYVVAISLLLIVLILSNQFRLRSWLAVGTLIGLIAVGLSLSRGAWVAWLVGLDLAVGVTGTKSVRMKLGVLATTVTLLAIIVIGDVELSSRIIHLPSTPKTAALFMCADYTRAQAVEQRTTGTLFEPPTEITALNSFARLTSLRLFAEMSVSQRARTYARALADWMQHPWIGNGANTFGQKYSKLQGVDPWISNATIMALHDTGIIGCALLGAWFIWIGYDALQTIRRAKPSSRRTTLLALSIGLLALLIVYQFTTGLWVGFTWVYLGLIRAGTLSLQQKRAEEERVSSSASHSF